MIDKSEIESLIGTQIDTLHNDGTVNTTITIKDVFTNKNGEYIIVDEHGCYWPEYQINWSYKLTTGALLASWLHECGYIAEDKIWTVDMNVYEVQFKSLIDKLIKHGYIGEN